MIDPTQGDPRLILTQDGSYLQFTGGQPLMDQGLENLVMISLFTSRGWCGNSFLLESIGSDFEAACNQPITKTSLLLIASAAKAALNHPLFGSVSVTVSNPSGSNLKVSILIIPPGGTVEEILLLRSGGNWISQMLNPSYKRITGPSPIMPGYGGQAWGDNWGG